jgi:hypothetical protein
MKKEIVICADGHAELLDGDERVLWSSDTDPDFRESISQEFLTSEDADDILDYLAESEVLTDDEIEKFESGDWPVSEETDDDGESPDDDESDIIDEDDENE